MIGNMETVVLLSLARKKKEGIFYMKKFFVMIMVLVVALAISGVAMAAPTTDLQQGNVTAGFSVASPTVQFDGTSKDTSIRFDYNLNVGIADRVQLGASFGQAAIESNSFKTREFNATYKLDNNVYGVVGLDNARAIGNQAQTKNYYEVGVVGVLPIADRVNAYGEVNYGANVQKYAVGVTYDLMKNTIFNVEYSDNQYKGFGDLGIGKITVSGVSAGLTYKF